MATQISIAATDAVKAEGLTGNTPYTFTLTRTGDTSLAQAVIWTVAGAGASPADANDFANAQLPSGVVSFGIGETSKTVTVNVAGDSTAENDEGFAVNLSTPTNGATLGTASAGGTILNDDAGSVSISPVIVVEGPSGTTTQAIFTVTRTGGSAPFTLHYNTSDLTATVADNDYVAASGTLSFGAGVDTQTIAVTINGDAKVETKYTTEFDFPTDLDEKFAVNLTQSGANTVKFLQNSTIGYIQDDDVEADLQTVPLIVSEGSNGSTQVGFTIYLYGSVLAPHSVHWAVTGSGSNPVTASDFAGGVLPSGTIVVPPIGAGFIGDYTNSVEGFFDVAGDTAAEANEGFTLTITDVDGSVTVGEGGDSGIIVDDDSPTAPTVISIVSLNTLPTREGSPSDPATFSYLVTRNGDTSQAGTVAYAVTGSGAAPASAADFEGGIFPTGTVSFAAGQNIAYITFKDAPDTIYEPDEGFTVTLSNPSGGATLDNATAAGTILNDDLAIGDVSVSNASVTEGGDLVFTVTRTGGTGAFSFKYATADGTATAGNGDYSPVSGTLSFATGVNTKTITVHTHDDGLVEPNETVLLNFTNATVGTDLMTSQATGTIVNNDVPGTLSIGNASLTEGSNGTKLMNFVVTLTGGNAPATVQYSTADGTATASSNDYVAKTGTVSVNSGGTAVISVVVNGDTQVEPDENFSVILFGSTNGATVSHAQGVGTILNDDVSGSVSISDASVTEGDSGTRLETFTVTRSGGTAPFTIGYSTYDRSATAADGDYDPTSGFLNFAAGVNSLTFSAVVNGDTRFESDENFGVKLLDPTNGITIADRTGAGFILNDDPPTRSDFNGDGKSDILLQSNGGDAAIWQMDGTTTVSRVWTSPAPGAAWHVIGSDDFSGDGKADIVLQSGNGQIDIWTMNGATRVASTVLADNPGSAWHVTTTGDFNGDGKADLLLRNDDGRAQIWLMNGTAITRENTLASNPGPTWSIKGAGDFNNDGKSDIVWQNDNGKVVIWTMNGGTVTSTATLSTNPGPTWHVDGIGDFNGDGKSDIVLQNDNGQVAIWLMNGSTITSRTILGNNPGSSWQVKGTGDYNGDGRSDILLQNTNGNAAVWIMNGASITSTSPVGGTPGPTWHVVAG